MSPPSQDTPAPRWKHDGVCVVAGDQLDANTAQTPGMDRKAAINFARVGAHKQPSYRVVVADGRSARDGRSLETLGHYNPRTDPTEFVVDADRAKAWLAKGAQPSDTVARLFRQAGILPAAK